MRILKGWRTGHLNKYENKYEALRKFYARYVSLLHFIDEQRNLILPEDVRIKLQTAYNLVV